MNAIGDRAASAGVGSRIRVAIALLTLGVLGAPGPLGAQGAEASCPPDLELLIERPFATSAGVRTGDVVQVLPTADGRACPARVSGIFEPPPDPARLTAERPRVLFHLPQLSTLAGRESEVDHFTVRLRPGTETAAAAEALQRLLPGTQVLPATAVAERASTTFTVVSRFHRAIGGITLVAGGVFLACIMILKVQERRTPIAASRLIGVSRRTLFGWLMLETAIVSVLGGVLGIGLGYAASRVINAYYQAAYDTALMFSRVTGTVVVQTVLLALGLGLAAGAVAATRLFQADAIQEAGR